MSHFLLLFILYKVFFSPNYKWRTKPWTTKKKYQSETLYTNCGVPLVWYNQTQNIYPKRSTVGLFYPSQNLTSAPALDFTCEPASQFACPEPAAVWSQIKAFSRPNLRAKLVLQVYGQKLLDRKTTALKNLASPKI